MAQISRNRNGERGVTIVLVALAMVTILAMAALSIDVVTLYVARSEAQRAADAAAACSSQDVRYIWLHLMAVGGS